MPDAGLHRPALAGCRRVISFSVAFCAVQQVELDLFVWVAVPVVFAWLAEVVTAALRGEGDVAGIAVLRGQDFCVCGLDVGG